MTFNTETAKELLADTIATAFEKIGNLSDDKAFLSYLLTTANRKWILIKKRTLRNVSLSDDIIAEMSVPQTSEELLEYKMLVEKMSELSEAQRNILVLSLIEGYTRKEIAEIVNLKEETVKSHLSRAKKRLREMMEVE